MDSIDVPIGANECTPPGVIHAKKDCVFQKNQDKTFQDVTAENINTAEQVNIKEFCLNN